MRDAQGEEFKHFCMDLEFLLRRTPLWREIAEGILFQEGDIVEHGEEAEEEATEEQAARGAPLAGSESLGIGSLRGSSRVSHLLREHAPITEAGWELLDSEARERLTPALAARKLVDFAGPHGWEHSATNLGRTRGARRAPPGKASPRGSAASSPLVELRAPFSVPRSELEDADRGAKDVDLDELDQAARRIAGAENARRLPWLERRRHRRHHRGLAARGDHPRRRLRALPAPRRQGGRRAARRSGSTGPTASRSAPRCIPACSRQASTAAIPLLEHLRKILGGPLVWAPAVQGGAVVSMRGGDFLFDSGQDLSIGYESHDADAVAALPGGELQLPGGDARGGRGALALARTQGASGPQAPNPDQPPRGDRGMRVSPLTSGISIANSST